MAVSIIIPAYNESQRLPAFLADLTQYTIAHPHDVSEVIVVDDGSRDSTSAVAATFVDRLPKFKIITHATNQGKGAAVKTGVFAATGHSIVFMDADGATSSNQLPRMIEALTDAPIAIGSRWMKESAAQRSSWLRHIAGFSYRAYMSLFGLGAIDTMCGFKGYRREVARELFADLLEPRWLFDAEIAYRAILRRYRVKNFPIEWQSKDGSKLSSATLLKTAFEIWPLIRKIRRDEHRRQASARTAQ